MSKYTYKELIKKATECKENVQKNYKTGMSNKWGYYFAKALITHKDVQKITINDAPKPSYTHISRQASKTYYLSLAKTYCKFIEEEKRLPNYLYWIGYHISLELCTYTFARCLVYYNKYGEYDPEITVNQKVFSKPTETGNVVYDYFTKKTGKSFKTLDDLLGYVKTHFKYEYYYDDKKSNKQVIDSKAGNCTDLLQFLMNYTSAIGYSSKCIHVKCKSSGGGHVYGKFKHPKHTENTWITRDIACVANGGDIKCVWCKNGTLQAENPSWFMENLKR